MASLKFAVIVDTSATQVLYKDETGRISGSKSQLGGIELYDALDKYLRGERHFMVGRLSLEHAIIDIGYVFPEEQKRVTTLAARNMDTGLPARFELFSDEVQKAIQPAVDEIVRQAVHQITFRITVSPFSAIDDEVLLSGNFGWLRGLDQLLQEELRAKNFREATVVKKFCDVFDC